MNKRIENLRKVLSDEDAALIMGDINRLYFTGFKSSAGAVLITKNSAFLLIDFRYLYFCRNP